MSRRGSLILALWLISFLATPRAYSAGEYTVNSISLQVFVDGVVQVDSQLEVDPTLPRVNVTSLSTVISDLAVTNQDDVLLESRAVNGSIIVDTLGSQFINVQYTTNELTSKTGSTWVFQTYMPVEGNVIFPSGATILSMVPVPSSISVVGDRTTLTMPMGSISISYIVGVVGTKEHALALLKDAQTTIEAVSASGIIITDAESLLSQAENAYAAGSYAETEVLARQARDRALEIQSLAEQAGNAISQAQSAVEAARSSGRTSNLDSASERIDSANTAYADGDYVSATTDALEATRLAQESTGGAQWNFALIIAGSIIVIIVVSGMYFYNKRRKINTPISTTEQVTSKADVQVIFDENPNLRLDEKEVVRYINDSNEGVFITELRERFDLPKSSAWRMMRRLEDMEVIETEQIGRETFVRISSRYKES